MYVVHGQTPFRSRSTRVTVEQKSKSVHKDCASLHFGLFEYMLNLSVTYWMFHCVWKKPTNGPFEAYFAILFLLIRDNFNTLLIACHISQKRHHRRKLNNEILSDICATNAYEKFPSLHSSTTLRYWIHANKIFSKLQTQHLLITLRNSHPGHSF